MEIKMTSTEMARLRAKKKSKTIGGIGTMMMASMQNIIATVVKDLNLTMGAMSGAR